MIGLKRFSLKYKTTNLVLHLFRIWYYPLQVDRKKIEQDKMF